MLVESASARRAVDKYDLRQRQVRIARAANASSGQTVHQVADWKGFRPNRWIGKIGKVRQENSILVVVNPAHIRSVHGPEYGGGRIRRMAGVTIGILMPKRSSR